MVVAKQEINKKKDIWKNKMLCGTYFSLDVKFAVMIRFNGRDEHISID